MRLVRWALDLGIDGNSDDDNVWGWRQGSQEISGARNESDSGWLMKQREMLGSW